jgi:hypothetical protein
MTYGNDINELGGNDGLSTSVVLQLKGSNHVVGVLFHQLRISQRKTKVAHVRGVLHGGSPGGNLCGVTLDKGGENSIGKCELCQVFGNILLHLVLLETGGSL